jgi:hypothetical protein
MGMLLQKMQAVLGAIEVEAEVEVVVAPGKRRNGTMKL